MSDPLARRPIDTAKSWQALQDYAALGAGRSLEKLVQIWSGSGPTRHLSTLKRWSAEGNWQARVAAYDEAQVATARAEREAALAARRAAWIEQHMGPEEVLALLADQARGSMAEFLSITQEPVTLRRTVTRKGEVVEEETETITAPVARIDLHQAAAAGKLHLIKKYSFDDKGKVAIELYDAQAAQRLIGQHHGLFVERHELSGPDGGPIPVSAVDLAQARERAQQFESEMTDGD